MRGDAAPRSGLTGRAGPRPGTDPAQLKRPTTTVIADHRDRMVWHDTCSRSAHLRDLVAELEQYGPSAADVLSDVFLAAYQAAPQLRDRAELAPAGLAGHQIVTELYGSAEFAALRADTVGDPYAAALAVLTQAGTIRRMLDSAWNARRAAERAERSAHRGSNRGDDAVGAVDAGLDDAAAAPDGDGATPPTASTGADADAGAGAGRQPLASAPGVGRIAAKQAQQAGAVLPTRSTAGRRLAPTGAGTAGRETALLRAWGVAAGELERLPFGERARLVERLRSSRLAEWSELIGRFRRMANAERAHRVTAATGELVGVTLGDDITRVIPSELASLASPELRAVFAARYAAGELMLYDSRGEQPMGRGAIVACVDTSHSMYMAGPGGVTREAWAKACAMALLDQARHAGRDFVGILFSSPGRLRVCRFPASEPAGVDRMLDFAETFLGGGTSYETPLTAARQLLAEEFGAGAGQRGDIVLITDDECDVTEEWTREWRKARERLGFRVFGVAIGAPRAAEAGSVLDALCDNLRSVEDFTDVHAAADLFRLV